MKPELAVDRVKSKLAVEEFVGLAQSLFLKSLLKKMQFYCEKSEFAVKEFVGCCYGVKSKLVVEEFVGFYYCLNSKFVH